MMNKNIIIIGGGIGGLAVAALLGKSGYLVTLLEKNKTVGGRAQHFQEKGFTFDMGPSWYLMPDIFTKFYAEFGKKPEDFLKLKPLSPQYRIFFSKNDVVDIQRDFEKNLQLFEFIENGSAKKIREYVKKSEYIYKTAMRYFIYKNYDSILDFFNKKLLIEGATLGLHKNLDAFLSAYTKNDRIKKILEYSTVFLGISPKRAPALFALMSYVDFKMGVYYPEGGTNTIVSSLVTLCKKNHVRILTNQEVTRIVVKNQEAREVWTKDKKYTADVIISNADYAFTETKLLEKRYQTYDQTFWKKKTLAPSAFILYVGIKGKVQGLHHHNLFFENDWQKHFDQIFENPKWPDAPSFYVCCPSKTDPSVAPKNCENLFVLVPIAAGLKDASKIRKAYAEKIITCIESLTKNNIRDNIVFQKTFSINDYKELYNSYQGTALGLAHTLFQSAGFRPKNKSRKVKNLYYVGQYTIPGIGMPMCLISATVLRDRIERDFGV